MKRLTQIFQALLGVVALILTAIVALGRLAWRTIRNWWKKRLKRIRRLIVATFVILIASVSARTAYMFYDDMYGRNYYWDTKLNNDMELHSFADDKWRLYDTRSGEYTTDKIDWMLNSSDNDSLAVYADAGRRGYINLSTGHIAIDAEGNDYRKAWIFSEGVAAVMKDGKIGFINAQNEVVIPFLFDYSDKCRMYDFGYVFHNGYCIMTNADGDLGLIDKNGNWVVEPAYDEIWAPHKSGYRVIIKDNMHGIMNPAAEVIYPTEYIHAYIVSDGFVLTKGGRRWQVDFKGNIVQPFMYDNTYYLRYPICYNDSGDIRYGFADFVKYEIMDCYGIMNRITGEPVTPAIYSDVNMLTDELFEVQDYYGYDRYLIDSKGNTVSKQTDHAL